MMTTVLNSLKRIWRKVIVRIFYNPNTIEEFYRKEGVRIGYGNRIHTRDLGSEPYLLKIGNDCVLSANVRFITHDGGSGIFRKEIPNLNVFGKIEIKDGCFIGMDAILMPNIVIGPHSVVGAGSVVTKDVPPYSVAAGSPARVICTLEEYKQKCIQKFRALNLKGPRNTWQQQLEDYFWKDSSRQVTPESKPLIPEQV